MCSGEPVVLWSHVVALLPWKHVETALAVSVSAVHCSAVQCSSVLST